MLCELLVPFVIGMDAIGGMARGEGPGKIVEVDLVITIGSFFIRLLDYGEPLCAYFEVNFSP